MKLSVPDPKIMDMTQEMPFHEVNKMANKMARAILNEYPVKRNSDGDFVIGMELANNVQSMIAYLAILKAGAAILAIDDEHPDGRVSQIIGQGQPAFVIVENKGQSQRHVTLHQAQ